MEHQEKLALISIKQEEHFNRLTDAYAFINRVIQHNYAASLVEASNGGYTVCVIAVEDA